MGRGVKSIWSMLFKTGLINLDFSTLRKVFQQRGGKTLFGLGEGSGANAVADAVASLKLCPLLHTPEFSRRADRLLVNIIGGTDLSLPKVNELMTAITEQFGRESHVIMGAVIDEQMQNRVEVCVLGTCDMNGRGVMPRRPSAAHARARRPAGRTEQSEIARSSGAAHSAGVAVAGATGELSLEQAAAAAAAKIAQEEFGFGELESRGHFEKTDRNLFDGQDLDVPTYLRRGIKISL
jgi:cell division protein FtsZ